MKKLFVLLAVISSLQTFANRDPYALYDFNDPLGWYKSRPGTSIFATTYYVRMDGSDSHSGTSNTSGGAFLTVTHALAVATTPGDIVHVVAGTYTEAGQMFLSPGVSLEGDGVTSVLKTSWTTSFYGFLAAYQLKVQTVTKVFPI